MGKTNGTSHRIQPPNWLEPDHKRLFVEIVTQCPVNHFSQADAELLASFCAATLLARYAMKNNKITEWEKAVRQQAILATKLRLTPSSRSKAERAGTAFRGHNISAYDAMFPGEN
jgi:phage terminase small subunit